MTFNPRNILIIDFGQLGDVVMSLPSLRAVREQFPLARITVAVGKPGGEIINLSGYADATIEVDRVSIRDGSKPLSIVKIFNLVKAVRRRQLREDAGRSLAENLAEGLALSEFLSTFTGAARPR